MQNSMKIHALTTEEIEALLSRSQVGRIDTVSPEGYPYLVPMHFVYFNEKIYAHGLARGQKLDHIALNPKVGFEVDEMMGLLTDGVDIPCHVNTEFNSVIIMGSAKILTDPAAKKEVLNKIIDKYTPHLSGRDLPEPMVNGTAVIEIQIEKCTGKFYK